MDAVDNRPNTRSRGISFRSDKSGSSEGRSTKLVDSPKEKAKRDSLWKGQSKANPNAAINELQPGVANITEQSTLQNLRDSQHKDAQGNVINDPDRSNPTRPRLERPLDTIRSFERAIDDGYKRRNSYMKQESDNWDKENQYASRRSSYFGGHDNNSNRPSPNQQQGGGGGGYYGSQSYYGPPRTRYAQNRMQSDPQIYGGQRPYPQHGYHQSHDTVTTGMTNGSDSTGPWANSTDPSSENSSIDKVNAMNKPPTPNGYDNRYGANGYHGPIMEEQGGQYAYDDYRGEGPSRAGPSGMQHRGGDEYGNSNGNGYAQYPQQNGNGYSQGYGQAPHSRTISNPGLQQPTAARRPIQLGGSANEAGGYAGNSYGRSGAPLPPTPQEKEVEKKGWLKRRFSKKT